MAKPTDRDEAIDFRRLWRSVYRNRWLVLGITAALMLGTAVFTSLQAPVYQSEARIQIAGERPGLNLLSEVLPLGLGQMAGVGSGDIQTDIAVLRSRQIAEAVTDSLALQVRLLHPRVPRDSVLRVLEAPRSTRWGVLQLTREADGSYQVRVEEGNLEPDVPSRVELGQPFRVGESTLVLDPQRPMEPPARVRLALDSHRQAVSLTQRHLQVLRPDPGAKIVGIRFRSGDPLLAAAVPNVATQSFIRYKNRVNRVESNSTIDFLQEQAFAYERDLRQAEARLQSYREQAQIVEPQTQASEQIRSLAAVQARRDEVRAERESLSRTLTRIEASPARDSVGHSPYRQLASFPAFLANGAVHNILQTLTELETKRSDLLVRRTSENQDVQAIAQRISELERQLYQMARSYQDALDNQIASLDENLARSGALLETIPAREVEFLRLAREQRLLDQVYTLVQTKLKEAEIQAASEPANVQVVDEALVPLGSSAPRPMFNLLIAMVVGLVLGTGIALARHHLDARIYSSEDISSLTPGLPVLGFIPNSRPAVPANGQNWRGGLLPALRRGPRPQLAAHGGSWDPAAEAYRALRASVMLSSPANERRILLVTSPSGAEDKASAAANLALAFAQQGTPTLLVDANLRDGRLHRLFGVELSPGLSDVLLERAELEEAGHEIQIGEVGIPLHLLCAGKAPTAPTELLGSARMRQLLERFRDHYEVIILDSPAVDLFADTTLLAAHADAVLLVAQTGLTDRHALHQATARLRQLKAEVSGVILRGADESGDPEGALLNASLSNGRSLSRT